MEDILRHEGGLPTLDSEKIKYEWLKPENFNVLKKKFEESRPNWLYCKGVKKGDRVYHTTTRGFLLDAICRACDEEGRSLSEVYKFLLNQVEIKMNKFESSKKKLFLKIGDIGENERKQIIFHKFLNPKRNELKLIFKILFPFLREKLLHLNDLPQELKYKEKIIFKEAKESKKKSQGMRVYFVMEDKFLKKPTEDSMQIQASSFNTISNASTLATFGEYMVLKPLNKRKEEAKKVERDGEESSDEENIEKESKEVIEKGSKEVVEEESKEVVEEESESDEDIISKKTIELMFSDSTRKLDLMPWDPTVFTKGGHGSFHACLYPNCLHNFYGWQGYGGSAFAIDLKNEISFAYVPNLLKVDSFGGFLDRRCLRIVNELMSIINPQDTDLIKMNSSRHQQDQSL